MPRQPTKAQLVVEGQDDQHVIWALCKKHLVPETFEIVTPNGDRGIDALLSGLPVRLKSAGMRALAVVIDADQHFEDRWKAVCNRLRSCNYQNLPTHPDHCGTIIDRSGSPKVGIWLMPDNLVPGMLEDFVTRLIPENDNLLPRAKHILRELESEKLNRYPALHHPKALIHTWLAWQEIPGRPMGQSITAHVLSDVPEIAVSFIAWLNRLFSV